MKTRRRNSPKRFLSRVGLSFLLAVTARGPLLGKALSVAHADEEKNPAIPTHQSQLAVALPNGSSQCEAMPPGIELAPELLALASWPLDDPSQSTDCAAHSGASTSAAAEMPLPPPIEISASPVVRVVAYGAEEDPSATAPRSVQLATLSTEALDNIRGGFEMPDMGLKFSFGIERAVYINNELVATTVLNVSDLKTTVAGSIPTVAPPTTPATVSAGNLPQSAGTSIPAASLPGSNAAGPATNPPPSTGGSVPTTGNAQHAAGGVSPASLPNGLAIAPVIVQNGTGNGISVQIAPNMAGTIVQNTLNDQQIKTITTINAAINSAQVLRALSLQTTIRDGIISSLRR